VRLALFVAALLAALAIPAALLLTRGDDGPDFRGSTPAAALGLPNFALEDDEGREVRSAELRGKAVAVTFLDARCTDACPIIAAQIGQAVRALGKDRGDFEALAITTDPLRDTPAEIDAFLNRFRAKGEVRYLDGTVAELRPLWQAFSVLAAYDTGQANMHSAPVRIYDREGRWRSTLSAGVDLTPANLVHDLREARDAS
jgi:protein SCO1/2